VAVTAVVAVAKAIQLTAGGKQCKDKNKTGRGDLPCGRFLYRKSEVREESVAQTHAADLPTTFNFGTMSSEKSVVIVRPTPKHLCPICGTAAYSLGGIHPQCAIQQADEPRIVRLRAARATESKVKKPLVEKWKKRCPICGLESHARREECQCGHRFGGR
jgi:molybdenum cofactor biosynthesis enzyme MoaA